MDDLAAHANRLADAAVAALPGWVERSVDRIHRAWSGPPPDDLIAAARQAGLDAAAALGPRLRELLGQDIDAQRTTPLAVLRSAVPFPTRILEAAGVPPVTRDREAEAMFPDDPYDLTPATFADIDPALSDAGIAWGAAKAFVHRHRHG